MPSLEAAREQQLLLQQSHSSIRRAKSQALAEDRHRLAVRDLWQLSIARVFPLA